MNENKISAVQMVNTIIIDEVSMVRCATMCAIDRMLRHCRLYAIELESKNSGYESCVDEDVVPAADVIVDASLGRPSE